jgi:hypothetical protein
MIEKIEQTIDVVLPFLVLIFSTLQMSGVIRVVEAATPIIYGLLGLIAAVFKIWGFVLRSAK